MNRRDFFKVSAVASTTLIGVNALASERQSPKDAANSVGVLVDTTCCIGCRKCEYACNQANKLPTQNIKAFDDKSVFNTHRRPTDAAYTMVNTYPDEAAQEKHRYMKVQCMHCVDPACASACIVGALHKTAAGPVIYDAWKCIGCRYCMVACPFQIPAYEYNNTLTPQVRKCMFCNDRISKEGGKPACVEICPNEALTFGPRSELLEMAGERIQQMPDRYYDHIYGEHEVGGTSWMYLASVDFARTELPRLDSRPIPETTESIQHGVFKSFVPPMALYGLLALAMHSLKKRDGDHDERA
jgi:formate dehydrogenase iron-sulfur subunit